MSQARIYADFQNLDDFNQLRLICAGTLQDLQSQGIQLQEGMVLTFYTDDADDQGQPDELRAEGIVHYDQEGHSWVAAIDWNALRHASEEGFTVPPVNGPLSKKLLDEHTEQCRKQVELGHESQQTLDFFVSLQQDLAAATEADWKAYSELVEHLPEEKEDPILIVLKGHLLIEKVTRRFVESHLPNSSALDNVNFTTAHLIALAESMCLPNDEPRWLWRMVRELNTIRNKMAHKLDSKEFDGRLHEFVQEFADNQNLQNRGVTNIVSHLYGMVKALCDLSASDEFSLFRS